MSVSVTPSHQALAAIVDLHNLLGEKEEAAEAISNVMSYHRPDPEAAKKALALHGHRHPSGEASAELALFMANHGIDPAEALKEAEKAYVTYKNIRVEDTLAWCHYKSGDYRKARLMIERAMRWKTQDPSLYFHRGMIYAALKDNAKAVSYLRNALALNPAFDPIDAPLAQEKIDSIEAARKKKGERKTKSQDAADE